MDGSFNGILLSIIIVSYNTKDILLQTLSSVEQAIQNISSEIFVVDNASSDGSNELVLKYFPWVHLIRNALNHGFAVANNQAIRKAKGRYILLLNSDTIVSLDTFTIMINFMEQHPQAGAAGCKVIKADGTLDLACRRSFPTLSNSFYKIVGLDKAFPDIPRFSSYNLRYLDPDKSYQVDCLVGAFMLVRRDVVTTIGLLDEAFFMYGEDIDWCYRIKQAGFEIWYYPSTTIVHLKGASSQRRKAKILYEFHKAMYIFYRKHYSVNSPKIKNLIIYFGIISKCIFTLGINLFKSR